MQSDSRIAEILDGIEFRDPPPVPPSAEETHQLPVEDFLRKIAWRPGEWAVFRSGLGPATANIRAATYKKHHPNSEWVVRPDDDGTSTLYARVLYV